MSITGDPTLYNLLCSQPFYLVLKIFKGNPRLSNSSAVVLIKIRIFTLKNPFSLFQAG